MSFTVLLAAIGLWLFIEGAIYAVAPDFMRRMSQMMADSPRDQVALTGLIAATVGAALIFFTLSSA